MTNFEKIKQMSVEELVEVINGGHCGEQYDKCKCHIIETCAECTRDWLESKVEE